MKRFKLLSLIAVFTALFTSCGNNTNDYSNDKEYWKSVEREERLRDAGMENAAEIERNSRLDYMEGDSYTSPTGERQVHYKGSVEQQRDLEMIDEWIRNNPDVY